MNYSTRPATRPSDPFNDSALERQKRMGLLSGDGQLQPEAMDAFCSLYAGLFFDDLCDSCTDFETAGTICRRLIALIQKEEPRRALLALSVQYDAMKRSLPDPIWWIAGNALLVSAFIRGFALKLQILVGTERR